MEEIVKSLKNNDGATFKKGSPVSYKSGWQVATQGIERKTVKGAINAINKLGGNCGIWFENGVYYIDVCKRVDTKKEALEIGKQHNQISIYGWKGKVLAYC